MAALRRLTSLVKPSLLRYQAPVFTPVLTARYLADAPGTSFARGIFLGELREQELFPYPDTLTDDQKETVSMMMDAGEAFMEESNDAAANDTNECIPEAQMEEMKALGMYGLMVPEEYGGMELNNTMYARFGELTGKYDLGLGIHTGAHQSIGYKGILLYGTPEQKQQYLPDLAVGDKYACFCLTEPSSGSDASSIKTRAELNEAGTHYILNGAKIWISNGGIAEIFTVFAQVPTFDEKSGEVKDKITAFIVERSFGGVTHGPPEKKMGIKCSNTAEVYFENVPVPVENLLGEQGEGFKVAMNILNNGRFGMGACLTGTMKMLIGKATEHANQRKQFVSKLKDYQGIQEKIAMMNMLCYANESMAYMLCGNMDRGAPEYQLEAAISKVFASDAAWKVCDETIQILGGAGFMKDVGVERWMRDLRIFRIFEGTNDILKLFIALNGVQDIGKKLKAGGMGHIGKLIASSSPVKEALGIQVVEKKVHSDLVRSSNLLSKDIREFAFASAQVVIKHKKKIIEEQVLLNHIAEMAIYLQSMASCISRAQAASERGDTSEIAIANAWCGYSHLRIKEHIKAVQADSPLDKSIRDIGISSLNESGYIASSPIGV